MTARPAPERGGEAVAVDPVDRTLAEFGGDALPAMTLDH